MGVTYHFGYPNIQRVVAIDEAVKKNYAHGLCSYSIAHMV